MRITERRYGLEIRTEPTYSAGYQDSPGSLIGYASKFNSLSGDLGGFRERVDRHAFDRTLSDPKLDCKALINHDPSLVLGRTKNGTVQLATDYTGLQTRIILPNTSYARDLYTSVQRGDVSQMSFGFAVEDEDWGDETDPDDATQSIKVRTLRSVHLMDVSAVTYPAYDSSEIHVGTPSPSMFNSLPLPPPEALFPQGLPMEVRSHVGERRVVLPSDLERRRALVHQFFSL